MYKVKFFEGSHEAKDVENRINSWLEEKQKTCPNFAPISIGVGMLGSVDGYGTGGIGILYRD